MTESDAYRRCFELFTLRDYEGCARASKPLIDEAKTHELLQVFLISLYRSGQHESAEELTPAINEATTHDRWTNSLLRLTMGQTGPDEVRGLVRDARQRCQGCYYIGANQLTHGYHEDAYQAFDASAETGVRCTEADLARLERAAPVMSAVAQRGGMTAEQFDWFDQRARAAGLALQGGRSDKAIEIARQMFQRACDTLDEDGVGMGAALQQIAMVHFFLGDYSTAGPMFREAKDLFLENYGARHRMYVECLQQLAAVEAAGGSASKASELVAEQCRLLTLTIGARAAGPV